MRNVHQQGKKEGEEKSEWAKDCCLDCLASTSSLCFVSLRCFIPFLADLLSLHLAIYFIASGTEKRTDFPADTALCFPNLTGYASDLPLRVPVAKPESKDN